VLALPVLVLFFPLKTIIPALITVNLLQTVYFSWSERKYINTFHVKSITLLSLCGLPIGYFIYQYLPTYYLKIALGIFIVIVALWNLSGIKPGRQLPNTIYHFLNFLGGITQGAFGAGGPFLVIYASQMLKGKSSFRATLSLVWTILNFMLVISYCVTHSYNRKVIILIALSVPFIIIGSLLGKILHDKIPQKPFNTLVFTILLFSGIIFLKPLLPF